MSMQFTSETIAGRDVVFDLVLEDIPGGVQLDTDQLVADAEWVERGSPVYVDKDTRIAYLVKSSAIYASGTSQAVKVGIDNHWAAGDYVTDGHVVSAISSITAGTTYDTLNLATALLHYTTGTVLVEAASDSNPSYALAGSMTMASGQLMYFASNNLQNEGLTIVVDENTSDALSVSYASGTLTIAVATGDGTTLALVQAAVNGLASAAFDFGDITIYDSWDYDASDATGQSTTLAATTQYKYTPNGFVKDTVNVGDGVALFNNIDVSVVVRGAVRNGSLPYPLPTAIKTAMSNFTFNY